MTDVTIDDFLSSFGVEVDNELPQYNDPQNSIITTISPNPGPARNTIPQPATASVNPAPRPAAMKRPSSRPSAASYQSDADLVQILNNSWIMRETTVGREDTLNLMITGVILYMNAMLTYPDGGSTYYIDPFSTQKAENTPIKTVSPFPLIAAMKDCTAIFSDMDDTLEHVANLKEICNFQLRGMVDPSKNIYLTESEVKNRKETNKVKSNLANNVVFRTRVSHLVVLWYSFMAGPPDSYINDTPQYSTVHYDPWRYLHNKISTEIKQYRKDTMRNSEFESNALENDVPDNKNNDQVFYNNIQLHFASVLDGVRDTFVNDVTGQRSRATILQECQDVLLFINQCGTLCKAEAKTSNANEKQMALKVLAILTHTSDNMPEEVESRYIKAVSSILEIQYQCLTRICAIIGSLRALVAHFYNICYTTLLRLILTSHTKQLKDILAYMDTALDRRIPVDIYPYSIGQNYAHLYGQYPQYWYITTKAESSHTDEWEDIFDLPKPRARNTPTRKGPAAENTTNIFENFRRFLTCKTPMELHKHANDRALASLSQTRGFYFATDLSHFKASPNGKNRRLGFIHSELLSHSIFKQIVTQAKILNKIDTGRQKQTITLKKLLNALIRYENGLLYTPQERATEKSAETISMTRVKRTDKGGWLATAISTFATIVYYAVDPHVSLYFPLWVFYHKYDAPPGLHNLVVDDRYHVRIPSVFVDAEIMADPVLHDTSHTLLVVLDYLLVQDQPDLQVFSTYHSPILQNLIRDINTQLRVNDLKISGEYVPTDTNMVRFVALVANYFSVAYNSNFGSLSRYKQALKLAGLHSLTNLETLYFMDVLPLFISFARLVFYCISDNILEEICEKANGLQNQRILTPVLIKQRMSNIASIDFLLLDNINPSFDVLQRFESIICIEENAPQKLNLGRCLINPDFFDNTMQIALAQNAYGYSWLPQTRLTEGGLITPRLHMGITVRWLPMSITINTNKNFTETKGRMATSNELYPVVKSCTGGRISFWKDPWELIEQVYIPNIKPIDTNQQAEEGDGMHTTRRMGTLLSRTTNLLASTISVMYDANPIDRTTPKFTRENMEKVKFSVLKMDSVRLSMLPNSSDLSNVYDDATIADLNTKKIQIQSKKDNKSNSFIQALSPLLLKLNTIYANFKKECKAQRKLVAKSYFTQQGVEGGGNNAENSQNKKYVPADPAVLLLEIRKKPTPAASEILLSSLDIPGRLATNEYLFILPEDTTTVKEILFLGDTFNKKWKTSNNQKAMIEILCGVVSVLAIYASGQRSSIFNYLSPKYSIIFKDVLNELGAVIRIYLLRISKKSTCLRSLASILVIFRIITKAQIKINLDAVKIYTPNPSDNKSLQKKITDNLHITIYNYLLHHNVRNIFKTDLGIELDEIIKGKYSATYRKMGYVGGPQASAYLTLNNGIFPLSAAVYSAAGFTKQIRPHKLEPAAVDRGVNGDLMITQSIDVITMFIRSLCRKFSTNENQAVPKLINHIYYTISEFEENTISNVMKLIQFAQHMCNLGLSINVQQNQIDNTTRTVLMEITISTKNVNKIQETGLKVAENIRTALGYGNNYRPYTKLSVIIHNKNTNTEETILNNEVLIGELEIESASATSVIQQANIQLQECYNILQTGYNGADLNACKNATKLLFECVMSTKTRTQSIKIIYENLVKHMNSAIDRITGAITKAKPLIRNFNIEDLEMMVDKHKREETEEEYEALDDEINEEAAEYTNQAEDAGMEDGGAVEYTRDNFMDVDTDWESPMDVDPGWDAPTTDGTAATDRLRLEMGDILDDPLAAPWYNADEEYFQ